MHYVEVLVAASSYHGNEPLTYGSSVQVQVGKIVKVPLRKKSVFGIVFRVSDTKPSFAVKEIDEVIDMPPIPSAYIQLVSWLHEYYRPSLGAAVQQLLPSKLPKRKPKPLKPLSITEQEQPPLTKDQVNTLAILKSPKLHILHGDTGTGKTRVYQELAQDFLQQGKSVLILTPEIALTSQLEVSFRNIFGDRVLITHSQLSESVRQRIWLTAASEKDPLVIIGPRSALFYPVNNLGLVIIDESHETSYKQDQNPRYNTTHVAAQLGKLSGAAVVLGSATPSLIDYFVAQQKGLAIARMTTTAKSQDTSRTVRVVDLRDRANFRRKSYLSDDLLTTMEETLSKGEQSLLFLNRRGTARIVLCESCGWRASCPNCDITLVYHNDSFTLRCHTCDFHTNPPTSCPECHAVEIIFKNIGTKAIAEEVSRLFPSARVRRFDTDNKKDERVEQNYEGLKNGDVDIIVGTQSLAKGFDLPKLSLVGIIIADTSLFVPDFSSNERTYQLINQIIGRVGRGHLDGKVFIQTFNPDNAIIQAAINNDWSNFYNNELAERQKFSFPPYCFLLKAWCKRATQKGAHDAASRTANSLRRSGLRIIVEGPAPAFHEKTLEGYSWQIVIKAKQRQELIEAIKLLPSNWQFDIDPVNLL